METFNLPIFLGHVCLFIKFSEIVKLKHEKSIFKICVISVFRISISESFWSVHTSEFKKNIKNSIFYNLKMFLATFYNFFTFSPNVEIRFYG